MEADFGNNSIIIEGANNFLFTDYGIKFDPDDEPFVWAVHDHQIVVIDQNQNPSTNPKKIYKYVLKVKVNSSGKVIESPDPLISN